MDCSHRILVSHLCLRIQEGETGEIKHIRGAQLQLKFAAFKLLIGSILMQEMDSVSLLKKVGILDQGLMTV